MGPLDLDTWQEVGDALRASPLRTLLTMAGVFWGMLILVLMLGFSKGLEGAADKTMRGMASNAVWVWGRPTRVPYRGQPAGRYIRFDDADTLALLKVPGIAHLAPRSQLGGYRDGTPVTRNGKSAGFEVSGEYPAMEDVFNPVVDRGRFISPLDLRDGRKVAVIGREVVRLLFGDEPPVGGHVSIRGVFFQVVGTFHSPRADDQGDRLDQMIVVPFTTFQRAFNMPNVQAYAIVADDDESASAVEERVRAVLFDRHGIAPNDSGGVGSHNAEEEFGRIRALLRGIRGLTWIVGTATILSGAIGVSNVLMIVVRERTREIGVRRAIGATARSIVAMIVQEALVITFVSGVLGLCVGVGILAVASAMIGPDNQTFGQPTVDPLAAIVGAALLGVAGLVASVLPAQRAVAIEPVAALRAE
ncbi:MAG: ABC transporter permease [Myxococcota bacterium]